MSRSRRMSCCVQWPKLQKGLTFSQNNKTLLKKKLGQRINSQCNLTSNKHNQSQIVIQSQCKHKIMSTRQSTSQLMSVNEHHVQAASHLSDHRVDKVIADMQHGNTIQDLSVSQMFRPSKFNLLNCQNSPFFIISGAVQKVVEGVTVLAILH